MAETFRHKDGAPVEVAVETLMSSLGVSREAVIWWMTQISRLRPEAEAEVLEALKYPDHPDYKHAEACAAFLVKERLTS